jgi:FkbM family methyltransferase
VQTHYGQMLIDVNDQVVGHSLQHAGEFEEHKIKQVVDFLIARHGFQPETFIDIGANIGTHLIYSLKSGLFKRALGVEADEANFTLLSANVLINGLRTRAQIFHCALSSQAAELELELSADNFGDHRIRVSAAHQESQADAFNESARKVGIVRALTFDKLFAAETLTWPSALVWIDTQGHEGHIFQGAARTVASGSPPVVVCEFWPYGLHRSGGKEAYFSFLAKCDSIYDINTDHWISGETVRCAALETAYQRMLLETTQSYSPHTDLLCILKTVQS